jgi:hypothetical protein
MRRGVTRSAFVALNSINTAASCGSAIANHSEESDNQPRVDPQKCQAATGATVAQVPESRPETVTQLPKSHCPG